MRKTIGLIMGFVLAVAFSNLAWSDEPGPGAVGPEVTLKGPMMTEPVLARKWKNSLPRLRIPLSRLKSGCRRSLTTASGRASPANH